MKIIINGDISKVVYRHPYRDDAGINLLKSVGVEVQQFKEN
jgi:deoxycytidylate deaminase